MSEEMVKMSQKELNRLSIMEQLRAKQITQKEAGKLLGSSPVV